MEHVFQYPHPFELESGESLPSLTVVYHTYGQLNADASNVVWVCHALTANADVMDWWKGVVGPGAAIDPNKHFIVCANILGSCYGSTGPLSINPATNQPWYHDFPRITIRDMVQAHQLLFQHLQLKQLHLLMGGSMGGYQVLEWAAMFPDQVRKLFLIGTSPQESAWGIAIHTAQRMAIEADASWQEGHADAGRKGLMAARAIGMLTYRNYSAMVRTQTDPDPNKLDHFKASSYLLHQGQKLANRFHASSYWLLTKAMDSHHLARGRSESVEAVLKSLSMPSLLIGIHSDLLCPPEEQHLLAAHMPSARLELIDSDFGHDGFLVEAETISGIIRAWLD